MRDRATRLRDEGGFTLVEVMVAMLLLSGALFAVASSLDASGKSTFEGQRHEQAVSVAEREIEQIRSLGWAEIGMSSLPTHESAGNPPNDTTPSNPRNPNYYVSGANLLIKSNYRNSSSAALAGTPAAGEPFVQGGSVAPGPTSFTAGQTQGTIYRYVTWRDDCIIGQACDGQNSKRVTVAVVLDISGNRAGPLKPVWMSTIVTDPYAKPAGVTDAEVNPGSGEEITAQPFFLYDTPCSFSSRQAITASHHTRNTAQAATTCSTANVPDLMNADAAPYAIDAPKFDYSTDLARTTPNWGLVLKADSTSCTATTYTAAAAPTAKWSIHRWATPAFTSSFSTPSTGARTAFSFWTQSVEGHEGGGTLCFTLSKQAANGTITNLASHVYTQASWPIEPTELTFAFAHSNFTAGIGERLLVTLSVRDDSDSDIALLYDHPSHQSFITVRTTTPLPN